MYNALDNTTLILSWGAASIVRIIPRICWFLILIAGDTVILRNTNVQIQERQVSFWISFL